MSTYRETVLHHIQQGKSDPAFATVQLFIGFIVLAIGGLGWFFYSIATEIMLIMVTGVAVTIVGLLVAWWIGLFVGALLDWLYQRKEEQKQMASETERNVDKNSL